MAKKPETRFKEHVIKDLKKLPNTWFSKIQQVVICGIPDILLSINGKFVALELKASKKEVVSPLQQWELESIASSGGLAFITYPENWDNTYDYLKKLADVPEHDCEDGDDDIIILDG